MSDTTVTYLPARCTIPMYRARRSGERDTPCQTAAELVLDELLYCPTHGRERVRWISDDRLERSMLEAEEFLQDGDPMVRERAERTVEFCRLNLEHRVAWRAEHGIASPTDPGIVNGPAAVAS